MPIVWAILFVLAALIYSYPEFFVGLIGFIILGVVIYKINKSAREDEERQEREVEREKQRREDEKRRIREEKKRREEEEKKREEEKKLDHAIAQAIGKGIDACKDCKTITPNRCSRCRKCISCWSNRSSRYGHLCKHCGQGVASRECAYAETNGKDVCWDCLTVEPSRCHCGDCTVCHGYGGNECYSHSSDDDD